MGNSNTKDEPSISFPPVSMANDSWSIERLFGESSSLLEALSTAPPNNTTLGDLEAEGEKELWRLFYDMRWPDTPNVLSLSDFKYILRVELIRKMVALNVSCGNLTKYFRWVVRFLRDMEEVIVKGDTATADGVPSQTHPHSLDAVYGVLQMTFCVLQHLLERCSFPMFLFLTEYAPLVPLPFLGWVKEGDEPVGNFKTPDAVTVRIQVTIPNQFVNLDHQEGGGGGGYKTILVGLEFYLVRYIDVESLVKSFEDQICEALKQQDCSMLHAIVRAGDYTVLHSFTPVRDLAPHGCLPVVTSISSTISQTISPSVYRHISSILSNPKSAHFGLFLVPHVPVGFSGNKSPIVSLMSQLVKFTVNTHSAIFLSRSKTNSVCSSQPISMWMESHKTCLAILLMLMSLVSNKDENSADSPPPHAWKSSLFALFGQASPSESTLHERRTTVENLKQSIAKSSDFVRGTQQKLRSIVNQHVVNASSPKKDSQTLIDVGNEGTRDPNLQSSSVGELSCASNIPLHLLNEDVAGCSKNDFVDLSAYANMFIYNQPSSTVKSVAELCRATACGGRILDPRSRWSSTGLQWFFGLFRDPDFGIAPKDMVLYLMHCILIPFFEENQQSAAVAEFLKMRAPIKSEHKAFGSWAFREPVDPAFVVSPKESPSPSSARDLSIGTLYTECSSLFNSVYWPSSILLAGNAGVSPQNVPKRDGSLLYYYSNLFQKFPLSLYFDVAPLSFFFFANAVLLVLIFSGFEETLVNLFDDDDQSNETASSPLLCTTIRSVFQRFNSFASLQPPLSLMVFYALTTRNTLIKPIPIVTDNAAQSVTPLLQVLGSAFSLESTSHQHACLAAGVDSNSPGLLTSGRKPVRFAGHRMRNTISEAIPICLSILMGWTKEREFTEKLFGAAVTDGIDLNVSDVNVPVCPGMKFGPGVSMGSIITSVVYRIMFWNASFGLDGTTHELCAAVLFNMSLFASQLHWSTAEQIVTYQDAWCRKVVSRLPNPAHVVKELQCLSLYFSECIVYSRSQEDPVNGVRAASPRSSGTDEAAAAEDEAALTRLLVSRSINLLKHNLITHLPFPQFLLSPADSKGNSLEPLLSCLSVSLQCTAALLAPPNASQNVSLLYTRIRQQNDVLMALNSLCLNCVRTELLTMKHIELFEQLCDSYANWLGLIGFHVAILEKALADSPGNEEISEILQQSKTVQFEMNLRMTSLAMSLNRYHFLIWHISVPLQYLLDLVSFCTQSNKQVATKEAMRNALLTNPPEPVQWMPLDKRISEWLQSQNKPSAESSAESLDDDSEEENSIMSRFDDCSPPEVMSLLARRCDALLPIHHRWVELRHSIDQTVEGGQSQTLADSTITLDMVKRLTPTDYLRCSQFSLRLNWGIGLSSSSFRSSFQLLRSGTSSSRSVDEESDFIVSVLWKFLQRTWAGVSGDEGSTTSHANSGWANVEDILIEESVGTREKNVLRI